MKNSNDTIGNRTRELPACSALPRPPRAPLQASSIFYSLYRPQRYIRQTLLWSVFMLSASWRKCLLCVVEKLKCTLTYSGPPVHDTELQSLQRCTKNWFCLRGGGSNFFILGIRKSQTASKIWFRVDLWNGFKILGMNATLYCKQWSVSREETFRPQLFGYEALLTRSTIQYMNYNTRVTL